MSDQQVPEVPVPESETQASDVTTSTPAQAAPVISYDEAFPSLGGPAAKPVKKQTRKVTGPRLRSSAPRTSVVTQRFVIPKEEQKIANDRKGRGGARSYLERLLSEAGVKHHVKISHNVNRTTSALTVEIVGSKAAVAEAKTSVLAKLQTQASIEVMVPREHHGFIIGSGGSNLKALSAKHSVRIFMPKSGEESNAIRVVGTAANCHRAAAEIKAQSIERAKTDRRKLQIPKAYHPLVAGPGNATVKRIMEQTGVVIHVPPPAVEKDEITVNGERNAVARACDELQRIYDDKIQSCGELTAEIPRSQHRFLIGPKGVNLREINDKTGVVVEVPSADKEEDTIILRGERANLVQALTLVYEFANKMVVKKLTVPRWLHRHLLGKGGENARKLREERPKVHIQFPQDESEDIEIEGPPEDVDVVRDSLRSLADELQSTITYSDVKVEPKYHPYLIGTKGSTVNDLRTKSGASIDIPRTDSGSDRVRIEGTPESVAKGVMLVTEMAAKLRNQKTGEINVPHAFHSQIIGSRGDGLRKLLADYPSVNLNIPDAKEKSDKILIRGDKNEVDGAIAAIMDRVRDIEASSYSDQVHVFRKFHPDIIGKGGEVVNRIRTETNTRINVPAADEENDYITITGYKADVEAAKKAILAVQQKVGKIVTENLEVDAKYHPTIRGNNNRIQQSLESELSVQITVPPAKEKSNKITVRGPAESVAVAKDAIARLACDEALASTVLEFNVPQKYHRHLIGARSAAINRLVEASGVIRGVFPPARAKKDKDVVAVIGTKANCEKFKALVTERVAELEKTVTEVVELEPKYIGSLIARQFSRKLGEEHGVSIQYPRKRSEGEEPAADAGMVKVRGPKDGVTKVIAALNARVDELERSVSKTLTVPGRSIPSIMGQRGANLNRVSSDHSVQVELPKREDRGDDLSADVTLTVVGLPENCDAALAALQALVPVEESVEYPADLHRFMRMDQENGVRSIQEKSGCRIDLPRDDPTDNIVLRGLPEEIAAAKELLAANRPLYEEELRKSHTMKIEVPPSFHPDLIGNRGSKVNALRKQFDVRIDFPRKEGRSDLAENEIQLTGLAEQCDACAKYILDFVEDLKTHVIKEVDIHHAVHGKIIGTRGAGVRTLQEKYNVRLTFPKDKGSDVLTIVGPEDKVDECIEALFAIQDENEDLINDYVEPVRAAPARASPQKQKKKQEYKLDTPFFQAPSAEQAQSRPLMGAWANRS